MQIGYSNRDIAPHVMDLIEGTVDICELQTEGMNTEELEEYIEGQINLDTCGGAACIEWWYI